MAAFPAPREGILLTHFIVSDDVERSRRFYTDVLGGETIRAGEPSFAALANGWIIINAGGGPTEDKPTVTLETPPNPDRTSSFLNIACRHPGDLRRLERAWSRVPHAATGPRCRDPLLHPRPGWAPYRSRPDQPRVSGADQLALVYGRVDTTNAGNQNNLHHPHGPGDGRRLRPVSPALGSGLH